MADSSGSGVWACLLDGEDGKTQKWRLKGGRQVERQEREGRSNVQELGSERERWRRPVCVSAVTML